MREVTLEGCADGRRHVIAVERGEVDRSMPHHGMTPHISGTSLSAQTRYAAGVREILECYFAGKPIRNEYLIVQGGKLAGVGAHSYSAGNATGGSEEAAKFKR
jgi:formate dehydrogenase